MNRNFLYIIFALLIICTDTGAQTVRSKTYLDASTLAYRSDKINYFQYLTFEETFLWRRRYNREGLEKDSYFFHSVYTQDSAVGAKLIGFEFNFLHERFDKNRWNHFRDWNKIRMGMALSFEYIPFEPLLPVEDIYQYVNANIYLKFLHICQSCRGDKTTKFRRMSWGFLINVEYFGRVHAELSIKPLKYVWITGRFRKTLHDRYYGLFFELELNHHGYDVSRLESTKDIYNGVTVFAGVDYNETRSFFAFNLGLKMDFRNH
ncbi:MAG: hypothetical protein JXR60_01870 [Bacteroidales bacterium]|nr:hypothetical protein [Bacteroidales bacterium]